MTDETTLSSLSKKTPSDLVWEQHYRPKTWDELILPTRLKDQLAGGDIRNYLFKGPAGVGKTSTAYVLAKGRKVKFIDCSNDRGINFIKEQINEFCSVASFDGVGMKVIILDEIDALKHDAQQSLRGTIEKFSKIARFIGTCNYPEKIIDAVKSRLAPVDFNLTDNADKQEQITNYVKRLKQILAENGMTIGDNNVLVTIIKKHYPDMRGLLQILQDMHSRGVKVITMKDISSVASDAHSEVYQMLVDESNPVELYKKLSGWRTKEHILISSLQSELTKWLIAKHPDKASRLGEIAILTHKYGVESKNSLDLFITMLALCYEISKLLK